MWPLPVSRDAWDSPGRARRDCPRSPDGTAPAVPAHAPLLRTRGRGFPVHLPPWTLHSGVRTAAFPQQAAWDSTGASRQARRGRPALAFTETGSDCAGGLRTSRTGTGVGGARQLPAASPLPGESPERWSASVFWGRTQGARLRSLTSHDPHIPAPHTLVTTPTCLSRILPREVPLGEGGSGMWESEVLDLQGQLSRPWQGPPGPRPSVTSPGKQLLRTERWCVGETTDIRALSGPSQEEPFQTLPLTDAGYLASPLTTGCSQGALASSCLAPNTSSSTGGVSEAAGKGPHPRNSFQISEVREPGSKATLSCDVCPGVLGRCGGYGPGGDSGCRIPKLP